MKLKNIMLISLLLLAILSIGAVSAADDANDIDVAQIDDSQDISIDDSSDSDKLEISDEECLSNVSMEDFYDGAFYEKGNEDENTFNIDVNDEEGLYDDGISGTLTVKIDGKIATLKNKVNDDDEVCYDVVNDGKGSEITVSGIDDGISICIDQLSAGTYNVQVIFEGPSDEFSINKTATIIVVNYGDVYDITIDVGEEQFIYNQTGNRINITAPTAVIDNLTVKINDEEYQFIKTSTNNGYVDISQLPIDFYEIVVSGGILPPESATFEVIDPNSIPEVENAILYPTDEFRCGSQQAISLTLPSNAKGNLVVKDDYDNEVFNKTLVNGVASFSLSDLAAGEYSFSAEYTGTDYEVDDENIIEIRILPIVNVPSKMKAGEKKYATVNFGGKVTGKLYVYADDYSFEKTISVKDGDKVSIPLVDLDDGDFELTFEFDDSKGFFYEEDFSIEVLEARPRLVGGSDIKMDYGDTRYYKLTVYGTNAKLAEEDDCVEIRINGVYYDDVYTNSKGVASFKIPTSLAPGKYKITAVYNDDVSVTHSIVIKKVLKFNKVKVKQSAQKLVLKASVKKGLTGKIVFKFKGTHSVKIKNGVAKYTVSSKVLSKLEVGKKITYQASYLKDKVKYTVKVKK